MKENKFRGLDVDGIWRIGNLSIWETGSVVEARISVVSEPHFAYNIDPETVGQFICQYDAHGKEIYKGDYKLHCGKRAVCTYDVDRCRYIWSLKLENRDAAFVYEIYPQDEVAGNIHEDAES